MVGNDSSSGVWTDSWLFDGRMRVSLIKNIFVDMNLRVNDLIDFHERDWNIEKLKDFFYPADVSLIIAKKLVVSKDDFWCWLHNKSGDYTVRSEYWLVNQLNNQELIQETVMKPSLNDIKEQVWTLKTSQKIKLFIWRVLSGTVSITDNLAQRGIKLDLRCQFCGVESKSINHVLFICPIARQIWALSDFPWPKDGFDELSLFSNFHYFFTMEKNMSIPQEIRLSFPWIVWFFWKIRNSFCFEGKLFVGTDTILKIKDEALQWFPAQTLENSKEVASYDEFFKLNDKWKRPSTLWLKYNIGLSWSKRNSVSGVYWVLRDDNGIVLMHSRRAFSSIKTLEEAKLKSLLWAMECMCSHRLNHVIFASELVNAINRPCVWPSFQYHVSELLLVLAGIDGWKLVNESRGTNRGAFLIAQSVTQENHFQSYVAQCHPSWLN